MSSSRQQARKLILPSPAAAESTVERYATSQGWPQVAEVEEDPETGESRKVIWKVAPDVYLVFSVDDATGVAYVYVASDDPETADALNESIATDLDALDYAELLDRYDQAHSEDERAGSLLLVALAAPPGDQASVERISNAMTSSVAGLREAAIHATGYAPSGHYRPLLTQIARHDPDEKLQEDAQDILGAYDQAGVD